MEVITQNMVVEATNDDIRQEFTEVTEDLAEFAERSKRVDRFTIVTAILSNEAKHVIQLLSKKEQQHIDHVRETLKRIPEYPAHKKPHDHTKDALYFFVTSAKFACRVAGPSMDKLFQLETTRHYREEPHHPEYESIHGTECDTYDILEMAVDRMSRNIQTNGRVDPDSMTKYMPKFSLGDNAAKQAKYLAYMEQYKAIAEKVYWEMFKRD